MLVPGGRWGWLSVVPPLLMTVMAVVQAVGAADDAIFWWILAAVGVVFAVSLLATTLMRLARRSETAIRVDDYGLQLPGHGPVPWSQVEDVATVWGDKKHKVWWVLLRDGTRVRTAFTQQDRQLRRRWDQVRDQRAPRS